MNKVKKFIKENGFYFATFLFLILLFCFYVHLYKEYKDDTKKEIEELTETISMNELEIEQKESEVEVLVDSYEKIVNEYSENLENIQSYIEPLKELDKKEYLNQYLIMVSQYDDLFDKPENIYDAFSQDQINIMWRCIETETYGADFDSKVNVACVILNRIEHEMFPTDPIEIITKPNQFSYGRHFITEDTMMALEYAYMIEDTTDGCIAFRSDSCPKTWGKWKYKFTDNVGHNFYYIEERSNDN